MHNLLEEYLAEIATCLTPLPIQRRNEELREMRQHLVTAVLFNREMGQTEEEAVQTALSQFGAPAELGESLVWAWQRGETLRKCSLWGAAACAFLGPLVIQRAAMPFDQMFLDYAAHHPRWAANFATITLGTVTHHGGGTLCVFWCYSLCLNVVIMLIAGLMSGLAFPKRAVEGATLAVVTWGMISVVKFLWRIACLLDYRHSPDYYNALAFDAVEAVSGYMILVLSAWMSSRWRRGMPTILA